MVDPGNRGTGQGAQQRGNPLPPPLGVIEVIHAALRGLTIARRGVLTVVLTGNCAGEQSSEKKMRIGREPIAFGDDDLEGTIQPHDDTLVVTAWISSFLVKRVNGGLREWGRCDVSGPVQRARVKKLRPVEV